MATRLIIRNARLLTMGDPGTIRTGAEMDQLVGFERADVHVRDGRIERIVDLCVATQDDAPPIGPPEEELDAAGRVLMPGFVDCHTHACWVGDRLDEWDRKLRGASYLELLAAGGGIHSTVRAVRMASIDELTAALRPRLETLLRHGTVGVEIKSGYGLDTESELKMLRAIASAAATWPGRVSPTACLGHALDPDADRDSFVERTIHETLPAVSAEFPGITVDAYCEEGAWTREECLRLFTAAQAAGHPIRVHADQFHELGMVDAAIQYGYCSVDHLEATSRPVLERLAGSKVFGVMLPASGFHLDDRYADGRAFVDAGGRLAIATNWNPGSAPCPAIPMAIALACRQLRITPSEAITAATINGAAVLGWQDLGCLAVGGPATMILLRVKRSPCIGLRIWHESHRRGVGGRLAGGVA